MSLLGVFDGRSDVSLRRSHFPLNWDSCNMKSSVESTTVVKV